MIIDLLTQKSIICKVSYSDSISQNMISENYSVKSATDIKSWVISNPSVSAAELIVMSNDTVTLKEITYTVIGGVSNTTQYYKIYTSIDFINWYELPFKKDDKYLYRKVGSSFVNLSTLETVPTSSSNLILYAFTKLNEFSGEEEDIYSNLEFKYIKIVLDNLSPTTESPIYFSEFQILVDDYADESIIDLNILKIKAGVFYKQKVFEEQGFYPDMINQFLTMLENNGDKNEKANLLDNQFVINTFDEI